MCGQNNAKFSATLISRKYNIDPIPVKRKIWSIIYIVWTLDEGTSDGEVTDTRVATIAAESEEVSPTLECKNGDDSFLIDLDHILPLGGVRTDQTNHIQIVATSIVDVVAEIGLEVGDSVTLLHYHGRNQVQICSCQGGKWNC